MTGNKVKEAEALAIIAWGSTWGRDLDAAIRYSREAIAVGEAAGALTAAYVAAFAGSHPLAKKVGAWPSVIGVAGAVALASWAVADRNS